MDRVGEKLGGLPEGTDRASFAGALNALAHALEAKDPYTSGHSRRVSQYATAIGRVLRLDPEAVRQLRLAGELHDIGKIGVPERLLNKRGPLSVGEYRRVMEHTVIGEKILQPLLRHYPMVLCVTRWHHERIDGRGLPDRLPGREIPLAARIVCVADTFDAMTSARPYRPALAVETALEELDANVGSQLDARCVRALRVALGSPSPPPPDPGGVEVISSRELEPSCRSKATSHRWRYARPGCPA